MEEVTPRDSTAPPAPGRFPIVVVGLGTSVDDAAVAALGQQGHTMGHATTALAALESVDQAGPAVLVVDVDDPAVDAFGLMQQLRAARTDTEAVFVGAARNETFQRALELGVFRVVGRPYTVDDVVAAVAGATNRLYLRIDRRRHMQDLERRNAELENALRRLAESEHRGALAERLASVGQFASALGHEINGPLAYVQTNVDLARDWVDEVVAATSGLGPDVLGPVAGKVQERLRQLPGALEDCNTGLRLMRQLSRDLGAVARYQVDALELFDVNDVVLTACRIARVKVRSPNRLIVAPTQQRLGVMGSQGRLAQVVMNLVSNAVDAAADERPNSIRVGTRLAGGEVLLTVSDTGVGIPAERCADIFEPYVSFRRGGTGIGLGVVRRIVEEHGGHVTVQSEVGRGTAFVVHLPLSDEPLPPVAGTSSSPPRLEAGGRLLIVDDDALIRRGVARALSTGFELRTADGAAAALAMIAEDPPDLIVTDVDMPQLDGIAFHAEVARRHPELAHRFLFVTGDPRRVPTGLGPVLEKPFGAAKLRKAILKALA